MKQAFKFILYSFLFITLMYALEIIGNKWPSKTISGEMPSMEALGKADSAFNEVLRREGY